MTATIKVLKKVTLSLSAANAGGESGKANLTSAPVNFEFIYGLASDGLCPFESALQDKRAGESLTLTVPTAETHEFFGHLLLPLRQALGLQIMPQTIALKVEITTVIDAGNREVVQALAKSGSGCGGSCGCGC
ncbi:MAG: hypothetical protein GY799_04870 [Desulfobulbaceae bacterium]|nr:hypothetical protein [Desulfobulbaceae bacterium]